MQRIYPTPHHIQHLISDSVLCSAVVSPLTRYFAASASKRTKAGDAAKADGSGASTSAPTATTAAAAAPNPVSAYGVWVSEVMLQQTRVETVIDYWLKWVSSAPPRSHPTQPSPSPCPAMLSMPPVGPNCLSLITSLPPPHHFLLCFR